MVAGYIHNLAFRHHMPPALMPVAAVALFWETGVTAALNAESHRRPRGSVTMERAVTRQYIIVAVVGLIIVTSLKLGGFPPAIALAITIIGAIVILMMVLAEWPD